MSGKVPDWIDFLRKHGEAAGDELDLGELRAGDRLRVVTKNSEYFLEVVDAERREVELRTGREDRPKGRAKIMGCTFGLSSSIKPDRLFCGGNLEVTLEDGEVTHTTTAIREMYVLRRDGG